MTRDPADDANDRGTSPLLVVAVGASSGGLEPLQQLLSHVPAETGVAFVVLQHLGRDHRSMLAELLAKHAAMPVLEVKDGLRPEADHVYVIASGALLTIDGGAFRLDARIEAGERTAIDTFFRSLALDRGERAVGILLSGAGHDGTAGLRAIKERGGLTLAQVPETARSDSMPRGAIEAGLVDEVLPPEEMSRVLLEHAAYRRRLDREGPAALEERLRGRLREICDLVERHTGNDFASYKEGTLLRRVRRRLQVRHVADVEDYVRLLDGDAAEAQALVKDLLIGVTRFFRDPDAFESLARQVVPRIAASAADAPIRAWVAGCASGEEAYSIGILLREHLHRIRSKRPVQIFATDLDSEMLEDARRGRYPATILEQVGPERLARFFVREGHAYRVSDELRESCIFSRHSLIRDPPFSRLDLVSCRNVLIYLGADLQRRLLPLLHHALRPGGFLFLGPSEGIAHDPELFEAVDKKNRIFRKKESATRPMIEFPLGARSPAAALAPPRTPDATPPPMPTPREKLTAAFERLVLEEYSFPCAVVDERGDIALVAGPVARLLQLPAGAPTSNLLDGLRGSLALEVRAALRTAAQSGKRVVREGVPADVDDAPRRLRLVVRPMPAAGPAQHLFLVVFQERSSGPETAAPDDAAAAPTLESRAVQELEDELRSTRAQLKTTAEELEALNEEFRSSNEELLSTNEELQSANEEMQTSKEELQSVNEELETVNAELRQKVEELAGANSDLQNLFASTDIATVFLDAELRIARFTPAAAGLFHLRASDVGRPMHDLAPRFADQDVVASAREVLRTLIPVERHVRAAGRDSWFMLRMLPYRTVENVIAGVVITLADVSPLKRAEEALRASGQQRQLALDAARLGWWHYDPATRVATFDQRYTEIFGVSGHERPNDEILKLLHPDDLPRVWAAVEAALDPRDPRPYSIQYRVNRPDGAQRWVEAHGMAVFGGEGPARHATSFVGTVDDVTERRAAEDALARSREGLSLLADASVAVMGKNDIQGMLQAIAQAALALTGARIATCGHGFVSGQLVVGGSARVPGAPACPPGDMFQLERGGVHMALAEGAESIRFTDQELRAHPRWWGLPEEHAPMRGLLGVPMLARNARANGMILVTDKEGGEFTVEDESLLKQLATVASLALQHVEARISLEEADRRKDEFLAMLSHELRNPLAPIRNSLYILDRAAPGGEQARRAQSVIDRQVVHMTRLVDDLLDVTRISRGKIQLQREPVDLVEVVRRAVEDQRAAFTASDLDLVVTLPERPVRVNADRTRITQAVGNVLQNAWKFTPPGGKVTISVAANESLGQAVARVADTGIGIAPEMLPRVFEPFTQADTSLDRSKGGLGLGLTVAKGVVEMHGGTVGVKSEGLGKGAEFTLRLPLLPEP
jgi:two-component system, chemotaxis family, CheB/CheR fusion protein